MELVVCPHCETRVVPMSSGQCPACRRGLDGPLDQLRGDPDGREEWGEESPATDSAGPVSLATIRTFLFNADAEIARDYLEKRGIPAFLANAKIVAMIWILGNAIGYIRLRVPSTDVIEAMGLLGAIGATRAERELLPEEETDAPDDEGPAGISGLLDRLRSLKHPILWLYLLPVLLAFAVEAIAGLSALMRWVTGSEGHGRF